MPEFLFCTHGLFLHSFQSNFVSMERLNIDLITFQANTVITQFYVLHKTEHTEVLNFLSCIVIKTATNVLKV